MAEESLSRLLWIWSCLVHLRAQVRHFHPFPWNLITSLLIKNSDRTILLLNITELQLGNYIDLWNRTFETFLWMERPVHVWLVMGVRSSQEDTEYSRHGIVHLSKLSFRKLLWDTICFLSYLLGYDNHCDWHVLCQRRVSNFRITACKKTCVQTPFCTDLHLYVWKII